MGLCPGMPWLFCHATWGEGNLPLFLRVWIDWVGKCATSLVRGSVRVFLTHPSTQHRGSVARCLAHCSTALGHAAERTRWYHKVPGTEVLRSHTEAYIRPNGEYLCHVNWNSYYQIIRVDYGNYVSQNQTLTGTATKACFKARKAASCSACQFHSTLSRRSA